MGKRNRLYVGLVKGGKREIISHHIQPTAASHGASYYAMIGPFRTRKGAEFMRDNGAGNPHCQTVSDAERLAIGIVAVKKVGPSEHTKQPYTYSVWEDKVKQGLAHYPRLPFEEVPLDIWHKHYTDCLRPSKAIAIELDRLLTSFKLKHT